MEQAQQLKEFLWVQACSLNQCKYALNAKEMGKNINNRISAKNVMAKK